MVVVGAECAEVWGIREKVCESRVSNPDENMRI